MRERDIEKKISQDVTRRGGLCLKLILFNLAGWPDRTILLPLPDRCRILFMEVKRDDGKLSKQQEFWIAALRRLKAEVYVVRSYEEAVEILDKK